MPGQIFIANNDSSYIETKLNPYFNHFPVFKHISQHLTLLALIAMSCSAQEAVTVDRVKFNPLGDDWLQMEIQMKCNGNSLLEGAEKEFVENIVVKPLLVYAKKQKGFRFYSAEVEIMIMKQGDENRVYFYVPGPIVERDELSRTPDYFYIEMTVNGTLQEPIINGAALSSSIENLSVLRNMQTLAEAQLPGNEHLLMPVYFVPDEYRGSVSQLPIFIRREFKQ